MKPTSRGRDAIITFRSSPPPSSRLPLASPLGRHGVTPYSPPLSVTALRRERERERGFKKSFVCYCLAEKSGLVGGLGRRGFFVAALGEEQGSAGGLGGEDGFVTWVPWVSVGSFSWKIPEFVSVLSA